ncbi:hypothetical protein [Candidatus Protochlamydia phocaeensis]|uniref:hypothetical protein n=1 Tax=Candidatus Protochlamydia phocaeensis TaxID=1414722 RepID=UPI0008391E05|nr:hypothetical protein [Candidatus Protochlamydia phocaeensis]
MQFNSFEAYQSKYETGFLVGKWNEGLSQVRKQFNRTISVIDEIYQGPDMVLKTTQLGISIFSNFPSVSVYLEVPKQFCKDARNLSNFVKGLKSLNGLLNIQLHWNSLIRTAAGITLFILSSISLIERAQLFNVSTIRIRLAAIPILGILPYGGLLSLSLIGLIGMTALNSFEKSKKLNEQTEHLKEGKLAFWSQPLTLAKIQERQAKYQARVLRLKEEVSHYNQLIQEGRLTEETYRQSINQASKRRACQKALKELRSLLEDKQATLDEYANKQSQWTSLEEKGTEIKQPALEKFRQAKAYKWQIKLDKLQQEKTVNRISMGGNAATLFRQIFTVGTVCLGYGPTALPAPLLLGLEMIGIGCGLTNFFMRRSIRKMTISPVDLAHYDVF